MRLKKRREKPQGHRPSPIRDTHPVASREGLPSEEDLFLTEEDDLGSPNEASQESDPFALDFDNPYLLLLFDN